MKTKLFIAAAVVLSLAGLAGAKPARADSTAVSFLAPYVQWAKTRPLGNGTYSLNVVMISNQPNQVASYSHQVLPFYDQYRFFNYSLLHVQGFGGSGYQLFNDRLWGESGSFAVNPFSPYKADQLGMSVDTLNGKLILTLKSWGNVVLNADLHAQDGVLVGHVPSATNPTTVVLSVSKSYMPVIY